ncbi:MAG: hypothetical protein K2M34_04835 [Alphaproteobacteria bacterium]|nr:hypothetical protein [Alphaproteobacteria bacterium]
MTNNKTPYYTNYILLSSYLQSQQNIPRKYSIKNYFGSCMRIHEQQTAEFLEDFINDIAIILPEHYDLMECILFVSQDSGYKPIKKLFPLAVQKFQVMNEELYKRLNAAASIAPINTNAHGANKYAVLENKKKMMMMSCSNLCLLGAAIDNERSFNTTKLKNKFASFVSYKIELVLSGKLPIDSDFCMLLKSYGTPQQNKRYYNLINNKYLYNRPQKKR